MANVNAQSDQNYDKVPLAVTDDANVYTKPLLVEPILGYLEIDVEYLASYTSVDASVKEDENFENVALASNETSGTVKPLKVHPTSGRLILDLT